MRKFHNGFLLSLMAMFSLFSSAFAVGQTTVSGTSVSFGNVVVNTTSAPKTVTLKNTGAASITINSLSVTAGGPYAIAGSPSTTCANPGALAAGASCTIGLTLHPTALGAQPADTLTISTTASNPTTTVALSGTGVNPTGLATAGYSFGNVVVNKTSAIEKATFTNYQSSAITITSLGVTGTGFALDPSTTCPSSGTLAGGTGCSIAITLTPASLGVKSGSLTITDTASNSPLTVPLSGTGIAPTTRSPASIAFGGVVVGQTSAIMSVTLTNNQAVSLTITSLAVTAGTPYAIDPSSTCLTPTVLPGASCKVALTLTPATSGVQPAGTLTISTNASNSPQTVTLSGTGIASVALSPTSISFGNGVVGTTSAAKTLKITNSQTGSLTLTGVVFNGPFVLDTSAVTTCPQAGGTVSGALAAGTSCVIGIDFKPTATGATSGGQITVIDSAPSSPQVAALSGTGVVAVTVSPAPLAFGNVVKGTTSAAKTVTLTNNQTVALNLTSFSALAPYAVGPGTTGTHCVVGTPVAPGASCTLSVTFAPTTLGAAAASTLSIADSASTSPQSVSLTGTGVTAVTLSPTALAFGNVVLGEAVSMNVTLTNNQTVPLTISPITGWTGGYSLNTTNTTCPFSPITLAANTSCVIAVSITATTLGAQPGTLSVPYSASGSPVLITLTANAGAPVVLSPTSLTFPTTYVGLASAPVKVTLINEQSVPLIITSASITGADPSDFGVTSSCPTAPNSLPAGQLCKLLVTFTPKASGIRTGMLSVTDSGSTVPQTVPLTGPGNPPVLISPGTTQIFSAPVGTTSPFVTFTITNEPPNLALIINSFKLTGDFIESATTCPIGGTGIGGAGASATCTVSVEFDPSIGGVRDGQLQVYDSALTSPQVVNLAGTGTSPLTISPTYLSFTSQTVGTVSPAKTIKLTNHETESETFTLTPAGDYTASSNCATGVIAANSSCLIYVNFTPSSILPSPTRSGSLTVTDSAPGGSALVATLTGSAIATNPPAAVAVVSPGAGASGTVVPVIITGNGWTHFSASSAITFVETNSTTTACDIAVSAVTAPTPNTINATLTLSGGIYGACNITVKTPLSGGGTETASLISAFTIADPTLAHTITSVTPAFGTQGQTLNVGITAVGTHFVQGTTIANFGAGVSMNSLTITDGTDAVANITISNTTPIGYRTVTMQTNGEFAVSVLTAQDNPIFQIGPNNATLVTVSPNVEPQGFSGAITLTATGTHFLQSATQVSIGGVIVGAVTVTSPTTAVAQIAVPAGAPLGLQNVQVSTGGEIAGLNNAFTITGATPALLSVAPSSGKQGQANLNVVITGNAYTTFTTGALSADFTGEITVNSVTPTSPSSATVNISIHTDANVGSITATLISGTTNFPFTFTVTQSSASIVSVVPNSVPQGGQMTLTVTAVNTNWVQGTTTASFYPAGVPTPSVDEITITSPTTAQLAVAVPTTSPVGNYGFYMATGGQVVSASIGVYANTPTLTMSPANGLLPTASAVNSFSVSFTGQFTSWGPTTLPVIAGEGVTLSNFTVNSPVSATATVTIIPSVSGTPTATGPRLVTFTTGGQIVTTYFNVTSTPVGIISINPDHTPPSTTISVEIVGLNTHFTAGTTQVLFGPQITVNSVTVNSLTDLIANISTSYMLAGVLTPSPSGYQSIYVNTGAEQVMGGFLVDYPATPSLLSVSPSSGAQGATLSGVVITGSLTNWVEGTTEAILGAGVTVSNLTITSATTATATIAISPTAPVGGNTVVMITGSQIVSGSGFSVTPSASYIQSVEPNFTCPAENTVDIAGFGCSGGGAPTGVPVVAQLQTVTLNIIGVGTHWLQGETVVSFGPGVVMDLLTVSSPTTAQVQITVLSSAPVGFATLTTSTDGEVVSLQQAIDIEDGSPILLAISPGGAEQGTTLTLQVLGRFTHFNSLTTSAAFNQDITVNSINVIDSENLTANITVSPLAYVDYGSPCGHVLTITSGSEQVFTDPPTLNNFCVAQGAEEITSVSPLSGIQGSTLSVTIVGSATNFVAGETQVSFGDPNFAVGEINVIDSTHLIVPVAISTSASTGFKTVTVSTLGQVASQQYSFTVDPGVGTLNEAIPNQAEQGAPLSGNPPLVIRLIGQYTHFSAASTATFGAGITVNSVTFISQISGGTGEVDANISIDPLSYAGGRSVTVTTPGLSCALQPPTANFVGCPPGATTGTGSEIVTASVFSIIPGPAIISNVAPNTGNEGQEVVFNITGSATHWQQNFTQFYIAGGGSDLTINSVVINNATSATVDMSISPTANPGARSIYMVTNGESLTDSGAFVVTGGVPVIAYLSPSSTQNSPTAGTTGLLVDIYGIYTNWATGSTTVNFGPGITVESFQVDNATHIEAVINIAANAQDGYRTVVVQTGTQGLTGNFLVTAPAPPPTPYIWWLSPGSALPGQTLTITFYGAYTQWDPNPTTGTVLEGFASGITLNTFQVTSPTTARANITISPTATASVSDLTLTTPNTTNNPSTEVDNAQFSVVVAVPTLSIVDPGSGMQGATDITVNILGQYTTFDSTTTFSFGSGITTVGSPVILGPTIATQVISIGQETPTGGYAVVATTPDVTGSAQVVGGAYFSVTPSLALISAITPNTSPQGTTPTVEVTGQNTHWDGSTTFQFGDGIVVTSTTVNSATDATLTLAIPAYAGEGPTGASAHTGGEVANITNGFVVTAGTPYLLSSGPGSVPQQGSAVFTILSQATTWSAATPPVVSYGPWITLTNTIVTGPTSLTVDGYVLPTAPVGYYNLTVSTGTQTLGINNAVYVSPGPAVINSVTPNTGGQGVNLPAVQINGTNTHWVQGTTLLTFPDVLINSFTVNSATSITANITVNTTAPAGQYNVTATTGGEVATGINVFTVIQTQPELLAVVPNSGPQGLTESPVTLTGDFTHFVNGTTTANFGTGITVISVNVTSSTVAVANITVQPTTTLGYRSVSVTTGTEVVSLTNAYQVTVGPAAIVGALSPATGGQGNSYNVVVTGSQTHFAQGVTTAAFGGGIQVTGVTVTGLLSATVAITIPNSTPLGAYNVSLTTGGEVATILDGFTVTTGSSSLSVVNPPTGTQGLTLSVNLTGLFTHFNSAAGCALNCSVANFGAGITVNSTTASDATHAVANITISPTATISSRNVKVTTGAEVATLTGGFSVLAGIPALTSAAPSSGQAGTTLSVVIDGAFTNFQATSTVSLGSGITLNFISGVTATQLTANITIAANATVGSRDITVTTSGTPLTLSGGFDVTAGTPIITQISPNIGNPGQTALSVTITGQYTNWSSSSTVTIGTTADGITVAGAAGPGLPGPVTSATATSVTVSLNIAAGAPLGPAGVSVTTGGSTQSVPGGFTVEAAVIPAPSLISLSPGGNAGGIPINSDFIAVFSQPMNRTTITTSTVLLYLTSNQGQGWITVPIAINVDATGRVLTITPSALLAVNSTYYLNLTNGIKDATGNTFNNYAVYLYTVFTSNTTPATVIAANPPALSTVGTNVAVQLEFSADMNQETQAGLTVSTGGVSVAGAFSWNSYPYGSPYWGPGTILTFTPTAPLAASTTYMVSYGAPLADTAGNALTPNSFTFTTGSGPDTATNYTGSDIANYQTNVGTNVAPVVTFTKPINPIDINTSTLLMYNADSGKYINGSVTVAANGLSATFTPAVPLLPDTYYRLYQAWGYYDADGNSQNNTGAYLTGTNTYFTTGNGADLTAPDVASIWPANGATGVPLNAQVIVHFTSPVDPVNIGSTITVTPSGGSAISGTATLASDLVTLFFVPTTTLAPTTTFTVQVSGYADVVGNVGTTFSSTFTTSTSIAPMNLSTGFNASGQLITTNNTADANWVVYTTGITTTPSESTFGSPSLGTAQPLLTVGSGDTGWWGGWAANGPSSDWININPNSVTGNTFGLYYRTFNISGGVPANLCLVGAMGIDDNGLLAINGTAIMGNLSVYGGGGYYGGYQSLYPLNIPITSYLTTGTNVLSLGWGSTDNSLEAFRLQAVIETCGASFTGGLSLTSATPAYGTTGVATNTTVTLTFNHPLDPATVNDTTLPVMIGWNSNAIIAGTWAVNPSNAAQFTFTPDSPFPINTSIYVGNCGGPYDTAGDYISNGSCYQVQLEQFTTGGTAIAPSAPFQVIAFTPAANATNVGLRAPVMATFNRSLNPGTINSSDFALFANDGQSPWCSGGSYSHSQDDTSIAFNCGVMPSSATMTAMLGSGLQDWNGDALTPAYTSQFTTSYYDSNTNGSVITTRPGNGASGVNANLPIVLYTNLPINAGSANAGFEVAQNNVAVPGTVNVLDNGYTLEFTPSVPWTPGALIQWWTTGSLLDTTYNTPINGASGYFYVAASTATLVPALQTASPSYGENPTPLNAIVDLQFNVPLNPSTVNSTNIYLYDSTSGLNVGGAYTMPQANEVRIVPSANFGASRYIYVYLTTGLQSTTSVPFGSNTYVIYFYTGTTADTTLPTVTSAVPYNGATNVGVNDQPGVIFNKTIDPVSVNSNTFQVTNAGTPLAGSYWFNSGDTRVEFVPNAPLPVSTTLTMSLNGVLDQEGHPITFTSSFTTGALPDVTAPTVVWTSIPYNGSVPTNSSVTIQFSTSMDATTFSTSNINIYDSLLGINVPATLSWNSTQTIAYLVPNSPLAAGRLYYLYVNTGTDLAGNQVNSYFAEFYAEFSSASSAPTVINFNPIGGGTGLGTNAIVEAQFSSAIDPNTLAGVTLSSGGTPVPTTPVLSAGNTILQLVPSAPLAAGTTYTMTIAGVKDPAGNAVATQANSFTTGATYDITNATAINSNPPNNSTVGTDVVLKLVFNKPLNPITVNNGTFNMYLNDTGQWIPLTVTLSADGKTVTMLPQIPLLPNTYYRFGACCNFQDEDGNSGNGVNIYFWTNGGAVSTGPTVTVSPLNGATGIPLNAQVIVSVSVPIDPTTWTQNSIQLLNGGTPVAGTVSLPNIQTLTFAPTSPLSAGVTYTVNVSGFTDANGNTVVPSGTTFTTGSTASGGGLTFTSSNITNGATGVSATQQIILTFSQILDPTTVNSSTLKVMNSWNSGLGLAGTYAVSGNQVTFTPISPYPAGATIYVGECGGPTDILGDVFLNGSCYGQQLVFFTVTTGSPDTTPLQVVSVSPASGATNVRHNQSVSVTFNKSVNPGSTYGYNTQLYAGQDLQTNGSVTMSADDRTMTFNVGALYNGTTYTIELPAGGVTDMSGNGLASTFTSTFTTAVNPATCCGTVQGTAPANGASGVPTDTLLTLYMNRQVNASTLPGQLTVTVNGAVYAGTVQSVASGYEIQFLPAVQFPNSATVQWFLSGNVLDVNGDAFYGDSGYFYTVAVAPNPATAVPTVIAVSPACCNSSTMPTNGEIDIQYSLPIDATTLSGNVYLNTGPSTPSFTVSLASPNVVRITPSSPWTASTQYGFCTNSSVKGTNGVAATNYCWLTYFTTTTGTDTTSGTVTIGPPNGSVNVGTNAYIRLQFSKPVDRTTINSTNVAITTGGNPIPGTWSFNYSGTDLYGVNFSPVNPLPPSSTIQVAVNGLLDYAGNLFSEPTAQFTTAALPDYTNPSVSVDFPYWQTGIGTNASFTCLYSEPMDPSSITSAGTYVWSYSANARVPVTYTFASDLMAVTMTPTSALAANSQFNYYCGGAIDLTGNTQNNTSDGFYTGSGPVTTGPTLVYANPPNGYTNVPLNTNNGPWYGSSLGLLFSEPVAQNSLGSITLTPNGGSAMPIAVYPEDGSFIVWVQLPWALQANTTYTYNIAGVTDLNGNPMTTATSTFTTGSSFDFTNASVTATVPVSSATPLAVMPTSVSVTFSEAMDPVLINTNEIYLRTHNTQTVVPTTLTISPDYTTVTLTPTAPLAASTIYDIYYYPNPWWLTDIAGNSSTNNYGILSTFTTP